MEGTKLTPAVPPPPSAAAERKPEDMGGERDPSEQQTEEAPMLDHGDDDVSEVGQGLEVLGATRRSY